MNVTPRSTIHDDDNNNAIDIPRTSITDHDNNLQSDLATPNNENDDNDDEEINDASCCCPICLNDYVNNDDEIAYSKNQACYHYFHKNCIMEWLLLHEECPICRCIYLAPQPPQ